MKPRKQKSTCGIQHTTQQPSSRNISFHSNILIKHILATRWSLLYIYIYIRYIPREHSANPKQSILFERKTSEKKFTHVKDESHFPTPNFTSNIYLTICFPELPGTHTHAELYTQTAHQGAL